MLLIYSIPESDGTITLWSTQLAVGANGANMALALANMEDVVASWVEEMELDGASYAADPIWAERLTHLDTARAWLRWSADRRGKEEE